eukprot:1187667-Prorocentrum_minimum.AAC.11
MVHTAAKSRALREQPVHPDHGARQNANEKVPLGEARAWKRIAAMRRYGDGSTGQIICTVFNSHMASCTLKRLAAHVRDGKMCSTHTWQAVLSYNWLHMCETGAYLYNAFVVHARHLRLRRLSPALEEARQGPECVEDERRVPSGGVRKQGRAVRAPRHNPRQRQPRAPRARAVPLIRHQGDCPVTHLLRLSYAVPLLRRPSLTPSLSYAIKVTALCPVPSFALLSLPPLRHQGDCPVTHILRLSYAVPLFRHQGNCPVPLLRHLSLSYAIK